MSTPLTPLTPPTPPRVSFHPTTMIVYVKKHNEEDQEVMVIELLKREFKGETASALGKSSDKTAQAIRELRIIGDEVTKQVEQNSSTVLKSIAKYNAAWQVAVMHRQNLIIQKEATGAVGKVGSMRVDVVKDSMSSGPGTSANEIVREQYPIPKMLDENGRFVVRMSEAYVE